MNRWQHEAKRNLRFEPGQVQSLGGAQQAEVQTGGREHPRTDVLNTLPAAVYPGQVTVMLSGGDQDFPTQIGFSPFVL